MCISCGGPASVVVMICSVWGSASVVLALQRIVGISCMYGGSIKQLVLGDRIKGSVFSQWVGLQQRLLFVFSSPILIASSYLDNMGMSVTEISE